MKRIFYILLNCLFIVSCATEQAELPTPTGLFVPINHKPEVVQEPIAEQPKPAKKTKKRSKRNARKI